MDGLTEGARDLVLAIFRMAVADYLALAYGHDGPGRPRRVRPRHRADAELFLQGPWASCLGEWINLPARSIWAQARGAQSDQARLRATNYVRVA
jgi:hypothetical protein